MAVEVGEFKAALGRFAAGVTVVTARGGSDVSADIVDHAITVSAFSSVSLSPPLILVCIKKTSRAHDVIASAGGFGVNILAADQVSVSNRFAGWWPEGKDKWEDLQISRGSHSGSALIGGALARLDCALHSTADGGDHTVFFGRVEQVEIEDEAGGPPLLYFFGGYRSVGERL